MLLVHLRQGVSMVTYRALIYLPVVIITGLLLLPAAGCDSKEGPGDTGAYRDGGMPAEGYGCSQDVKLFATPADAAARGPWPVGAKSLKIGTLRVEVWYPAVLGSENGKTPVTYDIRQWLSPAERKKIPEDAAPLQTCGCYRDIPLDTSHGRYPVIVFIHGTAGFRTQSLGQMEHWASRGMVVVAADYPGLYLADMLDFNIVSDLPGDTQKILDALNAPAGDLAFLEGHIDMAHTGMSGHSAGGMAIKGFSSKAGVLTLIPMAAGGTTPSATKVSTLVIGGQIDSVVTYKSQQKGYLDSAPPKRLLGIGNTGHLFPTDLCWITNKAGENIVEIAIKYGVQNASLATGLFDCPQGRLDRETTRSIVNYATAAALEEKLTCRVGNPFEGILNRYPDIIEYQEKLEPAAGN
jgi:hypothetical protein